MKANDQQDMRLELEEILSSLRMKDFTRAIEKTRSPAELKVLEIQIWTDAKLRLDHRNQLLGQLESHALDLQ